MIGRNMVRHEPLLLDVVNDVDYGWMDYCNIISYDTGKTGTHICNTTRYDQWENEYVYQWNVSPGILLDGYHASSFLLL